MVEIAVSLAVLALLVFSASAQSLSFRSALLCPLVAMASRFRRLCTLRHFGRLSLAGAVTGAAGLYAVHAYINTTQHGASKQTLELMHSPSAEIHNKDIPTRDDMIDRLKRSSIRGATGAVGTVFAAQEAALAAAVAAGTSAAPSNPADEDIYDVLVIGGGSDDETSTARTPHSAAHFLCRYVALTTSPAAYVCVSRVCAVRPAPALRSMPSVVASKWRWWRETISLQVRRRQQCEGEMPCGSACAHCLSFLCAPRPRHQQSQHQAHSWWSEISREGTTGSARTWLDSTSPAPC